MLHRLLQKMLIQMFLNIRKQCRTVSNSKVRRQTRKDQSSENLGESGNNCSTGMDQMLATVDRWTPKKNTGYWSERLKYWPKIVFLPLLSPSSHCFQSWWSGLGKPRRYSVHGWQWSRTVNGTKNVTLVETPFL